MAEHTQRQIQTTEGSMVLDMYGNITDVLTYANNRLNDTFQAGCTLLL